LFKTSIFIVNLSWWFAIKLVIFSDWRIVICICSMRHGLAKIAHQQSTTLCLKLVHGRNNYKVWSRRSDVHDADVTCSTNTLKVLIMLLSRHHLTVYLNTSCIVQIIPKKLYSMWSYHRHFNINMSMVCVIHS